MKNILVVGAGLYGAICAYELNKSGYNVRVIDRNAHIGGNCFTRYCAEADCYEHVYGPHIFHTNSVNVWKYISSFVEMNRYNNRVKVNFKGTIYSFPVNIFTLFQLYGVTTPQQAIDKINIVRVPSSDPKNMEEYCLSIVGPDIYQIFVEGYTKKQWGKSPKDLPKDIIKRIPVRFDFNDNYFDDIYQGVPVQGYALLFDKLLCGISVSLNTDFLNNRNLLQGADYIIYTGTIDSFFDYRYGALEYRSLNFDTKIYDVPDFQGNAVVNYTDESIQWTRIVEHKHFSVPLRPANKTLVTKEYPKDWALGRADKGYVTQFIIGVASDSIHCNQELKIEFYESLGVLNTALETHYDPLTGDERSALNSVFG